MARPERLRGLLAGVVVVVGPVVAAAACDRREATPPAPVVAPSGAGRRAHGSAPSEDEPEPSGGTSASASGSASGAAAASGSTAAGLAMPATGDARSPFSFPEVSWSAREGDHVLAPPREWVDAALEHGAETQAFVYYAARLVRRGPEASIVRTATGLVSTLPNAFVLPLRPGESAKKGQVVLTSWASGTGLQRAIVVGGAATSPRVRYLDIAYDAPSGWGQRDDTLPESTFHVLERPGEVGTTVACAEGGVRRRWIVVAAASGKVLGLGFGGLMRVLEAPACQALPLVPKVERGHAVEIAVGGVLVGGRVTEVQRDVGRVFVERTAGGKKLVEAVGFGNVAPAAAETPAK